MSEPAAPTQPDAAARLALADAALATVHEWVAALPDGHASLVDRRVLVLGEDPHLLRALVVASHGALVEVEPSALAGCDREASAPHWAALLERLAAWRTDLSPRPCLEARAGGAARVLAAHGAAGGPAEPAEVQLSAGWLGPDAALAGRCAWLAARARPGALGVHRVGAGAAGDPSAASATVGAALVAAGFGLGRGPTPAGRPEPRAPAAGNLLVRRVAPLGTEYPQEDDHPQTLAHSGTRYAFAAAYCIGQRVLDLGCGAGLGTRILRRGGAASVVGLDRRDEALEVARRLEPELPQAAWVRHDLGSALPFDAGSFDVVVALEVLEHVADQALFVAEIERVLAPDGVALVSIPHQPFESFWNGLAGQANPFHLHVPELAEFSRWLSRFAEVSYHAQADLVASVVLPIGEPAGADPVDGTIRLPRRIPLDERGTITIIAVARRAAGGAPPSAARPVALSWGNHQAALGAAMQGNHDLADWGNRLRKDYFTTMARLQWHEARADAPPEPAPG